MFGEDGGLALFLLVAPLAPVAGVAASFGGDADPAHELCDGRAVLRIPASPAPIGGCPRDVESRHRARRAGHAGLRLARRRLAHAGTGRRDDHARTVAPRRLHHRSRGRRHRLGRGRGSSDPGTRPGRGRRADHAGGSDRARFSSPPPSSSFVTSPSNTSGVSSMNTIALKTVSKSYGRTRALEDIDLTLRPGITGLLSERRRQDHAAADHRHRPRCGFRRGKGARLRSGHPGGQGRHPPTTRLRSPGDRIPTWLHRVRVRGLYGHPQGMVRPDVKAPRGPSGGRPGRAHRRCDQTRVGPVRRATATSRVGPGPAGTPRTCSSSTSPQPDSTLSSEADCVTCWGRRASRPPS